MNYRLLVIEAIALIITGGVSSLIYLYGTYSNKRLIDKLFVPKNDSIWEHVKMVLAPILILLLIQVLFGAVTANFLFAKLLSTIFIIIFIPIVFWALYMFSTWDMIKMNITAGLIGLLIGLLIFLLLINISPLPNFVGIISSVGLILILTFYVIATFYPTNDFIFLDPETKKAKIKKDE